VNITIGFIILGVLIILSGVFSGVEAAYLALSNLRIRRLIKKKKRNAEIVRDLKEDAHKLIITLLIGNNLVNIGASAIATALALSYFGSDRVGLATSVATGIMTFMILVFGEIIPKSKAIQHCETVCLKFARPLKILKITLYPMVVSFDFITRHLAGTGSSDKPLITEEELKSFVEIGEESGTIEKEEKEMIQNIFKLNDIEVREIMTPKIKMIAIDGGHSLGDEIEFILSSRHSRLPLYKETSDNITGVLHVTDIIHHIKDQNYTVRLNDIARKPYIVPETKLADDLLNEMKQNRTHIAIVVDEYGVTAGIVTIEDVLEEIVGEIYDETDIVESKIKSIDKKTARVQGETSIEEINKKMNMHLDMTNGYDTVSGYILKILGRIPNQGEFVELPEFLATVEKIEENRIVQVKISKK